MDEGGMFVRLSDELTDAGFDTVRFSYRGHGDSDGGERGMTIAGELLDFESAFEHVQDRFEGPYYVVAKSFGAVSTCHSLERFADDLSGVVLWNPVLDIEGTFLDPTLPWGKQNFADEKLRRLRENGRLLINEEFEMGRVLYEELHRYDPGAELRESSVPALVVHGDEDGIVPYEDARRVADESGAEFHTIANADHSFVKAGVGQSETEGGREHDEVTVDWLLERASS